MLHVSATHAAILREECYKEWIHSDITKVGEPIHTRYKFQTNTTILLYNYI
jgi:hypothetical protein